MFFNAVINIITLASFIFTKHQIKMIVSSLCSLFMKHRFFLFHTPIIARGKVFSTTATTYIILSVLNTYSDWKILHYVHL